MEPPSPSLLAPWLDLLTTLHVQWIADVGLHSTPASVSIVPTGFWLAWELPSNAWSINMPRCLEGIELLVLLLRANPAAWTEAATAVRQLDDRQVGYHQLGIRQTSHGPGSVNSDWTNRLLESHAIPRVVGHEMKCTSFNDARVFCNRMSLLDGNFTPSSDYLRVLASLEASIGHTNDLEIPMRLRVCDDYASPLDARAALLEVSALAKAQQSAPLYLPRQPICRIAQFRSRVRELHDLSQWVPNPYESSLHTYLLHIWTRGIHVVVLPSTLVTLDQSCIEALHGLLGIEREGCVRSVVVDQKSQSTGTARLLSAVVHSSSVQDVSFDFQVAAEDVGVPVPTRRRIVQWLAYALFRSDGCENLTKVELQCEALSMDHVSLVRGIVEAEEPLAVLYPEFASSISAHRQVRVSASRLRLEEPRSLAEPATTTAPDVVLRNLRVLDCSNGWWSVHLPGYGRAWVEQELAIVSTVSSLSTIASLSTTRAVTELVLSGVTPGNSTAVVELLRLSGSAIESLCLDRVSAEMDSICGDVMNACPSMVQFALCGDIFHRLSTIPDSFVKGHCGHLESLKIKIKTATETEAGELALLFDTLADKTHFMAQRLASLEVVVTRMRDPLSEWAVLNSALHMLETNTRLTWLRLVLQLRPGDASTVRRLRNGFARHHNTLLPLGVREKAAVLSVVWNATSVLGSEVLQRFDARVLSTIFSFASHRHRRRIDVGLAAATA